MLLTLCPVKYSKSSVKVEQKVSGQFKTEMAEWSFAKIISVIDTTIKNGMKVVEALTLIAKL